MNTNLLLPKQGVLVLVLSTDGPQHFNLILILSYEFLVFLEAFMCFIAKLRFLDRLLLEFGKLGQKLSVLTVDEWSTVKDKQDQECYNVHDGDVVTG